MVKVKEYIRTEDEFEVTNLELASGAQASKSVTPYFRGGTSSSMGKTKTGLNKIQINI